MGVNHLEVSDRSTGWGRMVRIELEIREGQRIESVRPNRLVRSVDEALST
jgi:hypothetical protein